MMRAAWLLPLMLGASTAMAESKDPDPWEGFNRKVFAFNETMDRYVLKPVAEGYQYVTPKPVDDSVTNFFGNIGDVMVIVNDVGQLKLGQALSDTARVLVNTTIGFFGVFDVASHIGLEKHNEDFGQTLGYWGVGSGPYLVLPFFGPSTVRDTGGLGLNYVYGFGIGDVGATTAQDYSGYALWVADVRADLIASEALISGDKYTFLRSFYLQRRDYLINDGKVQASFDDDWDDFDDEEEEDWGDDWDKPADE
ncbi:MlaA family lipoprotein [Thalassolituus sp. LLYu03]|uniref:MlaA family lipoprotein n=1 Tax=Thalassolituus sp. LLYu03 TaxID=3421656 RepID=UPI003D2E1B19